MKVHEQALPRPNPVALVSPSQSAELKLLIARAWPPLKPLPVFKYESPEYRASIEFDKLRGEWVCRKTLLPSNFLQELRGTLTEIIQALTPARAEAESLTTECMEHELEKDAARRLQAMQEWLQQEDSVHYSDLRSFLTKNQQAEIEELIRLTLTARQLQCCSQNISVVFHALSTAGGKLATLLEIAERKKNNQSPATSPAPVETAQAEVSQAETTQPQIERELPAPEKPEEPKPDALPELFPTHDRRLHPRTTPVSPTQIHLGNSQSATILNMGEEGMALAIPEPLFHDDLDDSPLLLRLPFLGLEISAQIVWANESKTTAGVRFLDLTAEVRKQIQQTYLATENSVTATADTVEVPTPPPLETPKPPTFEAALAELKSLVAAPVETVLPGPVLSEDDALPKKDRPVPYKLIDDLELSDDAQPPAQTPEPAVTRISPTYLPPLVQDLPPGTETRHGKTLSIFASKSRRPRESPPALTTSSEQIIEISGGQLAAYALVFFFAVMLLAVGLTVGSGPIGKLLFNAKGSAPTVATKPPVQPTRSSNTRLETSNQLAVNNNEPPAPAPLRSPNPTPDASSSPSASSASQSSNSPLATPRSSRPQPNSASAIAPAPETPNPNPANPPSTTKTAPPTTPPPLKPAAIGITPRISQPSSILVTLPARGNSPLRVSFPEKPISASSSIAMASQLSLFVAPQPIPAARPVRLQAGALIYYVWPRYSAKGNRYGTSQTIKVRATINPLGQVQDVKFIDGSSALLRPTTSALREWRYKPTLLDNRPIQVQQLITIEFRPTQYLTQARRPHSLEQK